MFCMLSPDLYFPSPGPVTTLDLFRCFRIHVLPLDFVLFSQFSFNRVHIFREDDVYAELSSIERLRFH
jgi:hypothetical protein